ncbi:hypothetical protein N2152v2_003982 [Parachlorella kessleri]
MSSSDSRAPPGPTTPPAEEWQAHWARTIPKLEQLSRQLGRAAQDITIMRSSQLDAARLDDELTGMLREQFMKVFALFQPGAIASMYMELTLLLDLLIFWFSIRQGKPLPGMALMNLRYRNERAVVPPPSPWQPEILITAATPAAAATAAVGPGQRQLRSQLPSLAAAAGRGPVVGGGNTGVEGPGLTIAQRWLYCLGAVVFKYGWARLTHHAAVWHWGDTSQGSWRQAGWALLRRAESGYRAAALVNLLVFLRTGKYRSLLERLLSARLVYARPSAARAISFEYLNRQLVWHELSELLLFVLPLVDVGAIKRALRARLPRLPALAGGAAGAALGAAQQGASAGGKGAASSQHDTPCGICNTPHILSPWAARPCGHLFCYYCLRSHCEADPGYTCPICLSRVEALQRSSVLSMGGR